MNLRMEVPSYAVRARALYNYNSAEEGYLNFDQNDIVFVIQQYSDGWWQGNCNGKEGIFPGNYVEPIGSKKPMMAEEEFSGALPNKEDEEMQHDDEDDMDPIECFAKVMFSYSAATNTELNLQQNDLIFVTKKYPDGWWEGEVGENKGIFPSTYVEEVTDQKELKKAKSIKKTITNAKKLLSSYNLPFYSEDVRDFVYRAVKTYRVNSEVQEDDYKWDPDKWVDHVHKEFIIQVVEENDRFHLQNEYSAAAVEALNQFNFVVKYLLCHLIDVLSKN